MIINNITNSPDVDASLASLAIESHCLSCSAVLCARQKLINFAAGWTETMYCLNCLSNRENMQTEHFFAKIKKYIFARQCFQKEWVKYKDISYCPYPDKCLSHNQSEE